MTSYRFDAPLRFDLSSAAFKRDPLPTFAAMREAGPLVPLKLPILGKAWVTTTHAASIAMVKDNSLFVQEGKNAGKSGVAGMQWWMPRSLRVLTNNMLLKDEPDHRRLRKLVDQAFARRNVQDMRAGIERMADELLEGFSGRSEIDLLQEYSRQLPLAVICDLLGLPAPDRAQFSQWTRTMLTANSALGIVRATGVLGTMMRYVRAQIEEAHRNPRPGLIGELVRAEADGEKLSEDELLSMVFLLLVAGFETTTHLITTSVIALEENPEQKAYLLADPAERIERAVEELARYTSPVQMTKPKFVARDAEFFGQPIQRGEIAIALLAAANADPAVFDRPEVLDLQRLPNPHLVFSSGVHFCLGMQLARVEAQAALTRLYARYPNLALSSGELAWMERIGLRSVKALPITLNAPQAQRAA